DRQKTETRDVALVRVEQFFPYPEEPLAKLKTRYKKAREWVWAQEESQNNGGWSFMEPRLRGQGYNVLYIGRDASASPATGSHAVHVREQRELVEAAIHRAAPHILRHTHLQRGRAAEKGPREAPPRATKAGAS